MPRHDLWDAPLRSLGCPVTSSGMPPSRALGYPVSSSGIRRLELWDTPSRALGYAVSSPARSISKIVWILFAYFCPLYFFHVHHSLHAFLRPFFILHSCYSHVGVLDATLFHVLNIYCHHHQCVSVYTRN